MKIIFRSQIQLLHKNTVGLHTYYYVNALIAELEYHICMYIYGSYTVRQFFLIHIYVS